MVTCRNQRSVCFGAETFVVEERVGASIGSRLSDGAIAMCQYLAKLNANELEPGSRVLELGAGVGLCSVVLRRLFPRVGVVVVSDRAENRELIERNIAKNCGGGDIRFQTVDWSDDNSGLVANDQHFQTVLISDLVTGDRALVEKLIKTLCDVTRPRSRVILSQHSAIEDASMVRLALLPREHEAPRATPLQEFFRVIESNFGTEKEEEQKKTHTEKKNQI